MTKKSTKEKYAIDQILDPKEVRTEWVGGAVKNSV